MVYALFALIAILLIQVQHHRPAVIEVDCQYDEQVMSDVAMAT